MEGESRKRCPVRVNPVLHHPKELRLSLDGKWEFALDPEDRGYGEGWHKKGASLGETVEVPGCWQGQGHGHDGTDTVWDFRLPTRTFRATYEGTGWYRKSFLVPEEWQGKRIWINFGGVHPSADLWINEKSLGSHSGPFLPFAHDVTDMIHWGSGNIITVKVHEAGRWLGFAYNWQGNWSGLYRSVELTATGDCWLDRFWLHPSARTGVLTARAVAEGVAHAQLSLRITVEDPEGQEIAVATSTLMPGTEETIRLPLEDLRLWSPDAPQLYSVHAELLCEGRVLDALSERTGFVELSTSRKHFLINGEPYYMRGTGDFSACPETGSPDSNRERWRRKLRDLREYGYNYVRCQSYVPTPEYLDAADEAGLIVQSEMGMLGAWAGQGIWHRYSWPSPSPVFWDALKQQWDLTVMRDVNHPSTTIYCMSNELGTDTLYPQTAWICYRDTKAIKPNAMVIWTDGGFSKKLPGDFVNANASLDGKCEVPVIQHEFRWWSAYPDPRTKGKFSRAVRPYAIELAEEGAKRNGVLDELTTMTQNSQRLQYIESRGKLDACRRDNAMLAGICHFNAMDIGYSPQGVLDEFYDHKLTPPDIWLRTWGDTVMLIDKDFDDRVLPSGGLLQASLKVSDFSHPPLKDPKLEWELRVAGRTIESGACPYRHRAYRTVRAGKIKTDLPAVEEPARAKLQARLIEGERSVGNEWDFWIMPDPDLGDALAYAHSKRTWLKASGFRRVRPSELLGNDAPPAVFADTLDETLWRYMESGGRVALVASEGLTRPYWPKLGLVEGRYFFLPPANYPPYEDGQSGTIIEKHAIVEPMQHEGFADLQFYRPISNAPPIDLDPLGGWTTKTIIRALSTYFVFHPLAYLVEFAVGEGGLIISALDLDQRWPESRVLAAGIQRYAAGEEFNPPNALTPSARAFLANWGARFGAKRAKP